MDSLTTTARQGLFDAERRFEASAGRVARMGGETPVDLAREVVEQIQAKHHFGANLQTLRTADEMWRALLETQVR